MKFLLAAALSSLSTAHAAVRYCPSLALRRPAALLRLRDADLNGRDCSSQAAASRLRAAASSQQHYSPRLSAAAEQPERRARAARTIVRASGECIESAALEREFLRFARGEQGAAEGVDELESAASMPESPEELVDELRGYWSLRFTTGEGGLPPAGLSGCGDAAAGRMVVGHHVRVAPSSSDFPMQVVEVVLDTREGVARLITLKGRHQAEAGATRSGGGGGGGWLARLLPAGWQKGAAPPRIYALAPSLSETYDTIEDEGTPCPGAPRVRRRWVCTFLGERLLICRVGERGGVAVYERSTEEEVQRELRRALNSAGDGLGGVQELQQLVKRLAQGGGIGGGGGRLGDAGGADKGWGRDGPSPEQQSSIP